MFKIDKGVPIPAGTYSKYPWVYMKPGDSFFLPWKKAPQAGPYTVMFDIVRREVPGGIRIWRKELEE